MTLFFDTETNGDFRAQKLVQLAAILCDPNGGIIHRCEFLVRPDGWEVNAEATAIHGFTTDYCLAYGLPLKSVLHAFNMLCRRAKTLVAFNIQFDQRVINHAFTCAQIEHHLQTLELVCAMKALTNICCIPNAGRGGFKWPSLTEAHMHFFGEGFDGAHGALIDTDALRRVYFEMKRRQAMEVAA